MVKVTMKMAQRCSLMLFLGLVLNGAAWAWNEGGGEKDEALALKPDLYAGMEIFQVCAKCHYAEGWGRRSGSFPQIAGQHFNVLVKQLADMRERNRENPTMYHFILPDVIGDAQALVNLSAYISELPMTPANGEGPGTNLKRGEEIYMDRCVGCHGDHGEGDNARFFPRIQGQHYKYLLRQFRWIHDRERLNSHPDMVHRINILSDEEAQAVVDYVSRLKPPKQDLAPSRKWKNPDFE